MKVKKESVNGMFVVSVAIQASPSPYCLVKTAHAAKPCLIRTPVKAGDWLGRNDARVE